MVKISSLSCTKMLSASFFFGWQIVWDSLNMLPRLHYVMIPFSVVEWSKCYCYISLWQHSLASWHVQWFASSGASATHVQCAHRGQCWWLCEATTSSPTTSGQLLLLVCVLICLEKEHLLFILEILTGTGLNAYHLWSLKFSIWAHNKVLKTFAG